MSTNLISVILPTYNRKNTIQRVIDSVLNQTYENLELIIVDDGSTDNTDQLIQTYVDSRIKYIYLGKNQEVCNARNVGISYANGNYIAFQDSDDEWFPLKLEKQLQLMLQNPEVNFCYHKIQYYFESGQIIILPDETIPLNAKHGIIYEQMLYDNLIACPSILARTDFIRKIGIFDSTFPALEDYDYALRLSQNSPAAFVDEVLLTASYSTNGISGNLINYLLASCQLIRKYKPDYIKYNTLNHRIEVILRDAERLNLKVQFISLLELIMQS